MTWKIGNEAGHQQLWRKSWNIWNENEAGHQQLSHMVKDTCSSRTWFKRRLESKKEHSTTIHSRGHKKNSMGIL